MTNLNGVTALVTGGSRGLGKAISKELALAGAEVFVNFATNRESAEQTVREIRSFNGIAHVIQGDVTDESSVENIMDVIKKEYKKNVNVLVNNATGPQPGLAIEECSWQDYLNQLEYFIKSPLLLTKAVLPSMREKRFGRIINIGSEVVQLGNKNFSNYGTAKSAMLGMTRSWANELGEHGITVNLLNPGFIPVERHDGIDQSVLEDYMKNIPLGRMGVPNDIAQVVVFLASNASSFITGQSISVNGGKTFGV